ncbi:MAG: TIGR02147 family protein [Fibrobacter sp.]|nr:TIGR02147 family protein [Fibrobacter sp.]
MKQIFEYEDYRDYIRDFYLERKKQNARYSYSVLGTTIGLNASHVFCLVEKKRDLPIRCVPAVKKLLGLESRAAAYFDLLLAASRTKSEETRSEIMAKASLLKDIKKRFLETKELEYLSQWWTAVIRAVIEVNQGKIDIKKIANSLEPSISEEQARESIQLLQDLGFIKPINEHRVSLTESHLTIGGEERANAIRNFQAEVMKVGARSLREIPPESRDISTLTMPVDQQCFEDIKKMLQEFRKEVQIRVDKCRHPSRVMQMNLALFPVAFNKKEAEK